MSIASEKFYYLESTAQCHEKLTIPQVQHFLDIPSFFSNHGPDLEKRLNCSQCSFSTAKVCRELSKNCTDAFLKDENKIVCVFERSVLKKIVGTNQKIHAPKWELIEEESLQKSIDSQVISEHSGNLFFKGEDRGPVLFIDEATLKQCAEHLSRFELAQVYSVERDCELRADKICHFLVALGIPEDQVVKVHIQPGQDGDLKVKIGMEIIEWKYHVVAGIKIQERIYLYDPVVNPNEFVFFDDFLKKLCGEQAGSVRVICQDKPVILSLSSCTAVIFPYYLDGDAVAAQKIQIMESPLEDAALSTLALNRLRILNGFKPYPILNQFGKTFRYLIDPQLQFEKADTLMPLGKIDHSILKWKLQYSIDQDRFFISEEDLLGFQPIWMKDKTEIDEMDQLLLKYQEKVQEATCLPKEAIPLLVKEISQKREILESFPSDLETLETLRKEEELKDLQKWLTLLDEKNYLSPIDQGVSDRIEEILPNSQ